MAYSSQTEKAPPAAAPGTAVTQEEGMLRVTGPGFGPKGKLIDPDRVVSTSMWRDGLGSRTVLHIADGEGDIVVSQLYSEACHHLEEARRARECRPFAGREH